MLLGLQTHDLCHGLANDELLKSLGLGIPLSDGIAELDHAVSVALLHLGGVLVAGGDVTVGHVHLVLGAVDTAEDDLALSVGNDGGHSVVDLGLAGVAAVEAGDNAHAQLILGLGGGSLSGRGLGGGGFGCGSLSGCGGLRAAACCQSENHAQEQDHADSLFHSSSLSHFIIFFYIQLYCITGDLTAALCLQEPAPGRRPALAVHG